MYLVAVKTHKHLVEHDVATFERALFDLQMVVADSNPNLIMYAWIKDPDGRTILRYSNNGLEP